MPEKTKTSEEDYLDRLLNNVLNEDSDEDIFDNQEFREMSEDDFFDSIEKDLFENSSKETKKEQINPENIAKETFEKSTEQKSENEEQTISESGDDDIKGLYDILGVKEENKEEDQVKDDIEQLEKEKSGWRKKRKERKEKKKKEEGKEKNQSDEQEKSPLDQALDSMEQSVDDLLDDDTSEEMEEEPQKKKKTKKVKKPKKPKVKKQKPKKPKKPKEKSDLDEKVRISVPALSFFFSLGALAVLALLFGGNYRQYQEGINRATSYYVDKKYGEAYNELHTLDIKKGDEYFWGQVKTVMQVYGNYRSYEHLIEIGKYEDALDSLLTGVRMFDKYIDAGRDEYNCYNEMTQVLSWITQALQDIYGITESEAREINLTGKGEEYSYRVAELAYQAARKEMEANDSNS